MDCADVRQRVPEILRRRREGTKSRNTFISIVHSCVNISFWWNVQRREKVVSVSFAVWISSRNLTYEYVRFHNNVNIILVLINIFTLNNQPVATTWLSSVDLLSSQMKRGRLPNCDTNQIRCRETARCCIYNVCVFVYITKRLAFYCRHIALRFSSAHIYLFYLTFAFTWHTVYSCHSAVIE